MNKRVYGNISLKLNWQGEIVAIQPRTRVWRYLMDNRTHYHIGYNLFIVGDSSEGKKQFSVAISEKQQVKGLFRIGDVLEGTAWTKLSRKWLKANQNKAFTVKDFGEMQR